MELGRPSSLAEFSLDILEVCWLQAEVPSARGPAMRRNSWGAASWTLGRCVCDEDAESL